MSKKLLIILSVLMLSACGIEAEVDVQHDDDEIREENMIEDIAFRNRIVMTNVTEGIEGQGEGLHGVVDGETRVYASFMVDEPADGFFYEGWLVCGGEPYSTGRLSSFEGIYENFFKSKEVPEQCESYVLTLETEGGSDEPEDHVFEGEFQGIPHNEIGEIMDWNSEGFDMIGDATPVAYKCSDDFEFTLTEDMDSKDLVHYVPLDSGVSTELTRVVSASGEKFMSDDSQLTVWIKADESFIMEGEETAHEQCAMQS